MQNDELKIAVPALNEYFCSMGYFMIASVGHACEHALQPFKQAPSVGTMTGVQSALIPCSNPAGFKIPVGHAFMHSAQRMQLVKKSDSSRLIGGLMSRFADSGSPPDNLNAGTAATTAAEVVSTLRRSSETGICVEVIAGTGDFNSKKFASTGHSCEQEKHLMHSDSL